MPAEVTTVICRKIKPGREKDYNDWVRRYLTLERNRRVLVPKNARF